MKNILFTSNIKIESFGILIKGAINKLTNIKNNLCTSKMKI